MSGSEDREIIRICGDGSKWTGIQHRFDLNNQSVEMFEGQEFRDNGADKMPFKRFHRGLP